MEKWLMLIILILLIISPNYAGDLDYQCKMLKGTTDAVTISIEGIGDFKINLRTNSNCEIKKQKTMVPYWKNYGMRKKGIIPCETRSYLGKKLVPLKQKQLKFIDKHTLNWTPPKRLAAILKNVDQHRFKLGRSFKINVEKKTQGKGCEAQVFIPINGKEVKANRIKAKVQMQLIRLKARALDIKLFNNNQLIVELL